MSDRIDSHREQERRIMVYYTPKDKQGRALCHCCHVRPGSQMHELVNRAQVSSNYSAKWLSFSHTLCSWLCPECHANLAPNYDVEAMLFAFNFGLWGRNEVLDDLQKIADTIGFWPRVSLPQGAW